MILKLDRVTTNNPGVPRVGGGDPTVFERLFKVLQCSPRRRG